MRLICGSEYPSTIGYTLVWITKSFYICVSFMIRARYISSTTSMMVILLLLLSIVCSTINAAGSSHHVQVTATFKKPGTSSASDTQLPDKVESENDHKLLVTFFFIHPVSEILCFDVARSLYTCFFKATRLRGSPSRVPRYLATRSIII